MGYDTTTNYGIRKPLPGASRNEWPATWRYGLDQIDTALLTKFDKAGGTVTGGITINTGAATSGTQLNVTRNSLSSGATFGVDGGGTIAVGASAGDTVLRMAGGTSILRIADSSGAIKATWDTATGLSVAGILGTTGQITSDASLRVKKNGSDAFAAGPYAYLTDAAASTGFLLQLSAANHLDFFTSTYTAAPVVRFQTSGAISAAVDNFRVSNVGSVTNTYNSYGAISERRFKENIVEASRKLAKLLQFKVYNFNLIDDPQKLKQLGLIVDEVEQISPGLIEITPDYEDVVVEPESFDRQTVLRQRFEKRLEDRVAETIEVVDGRAILKRRSESVELDVPVLVERLIFDEAGEPVMVEVEPAREAALDADGRVLVPAKPAVLRQAVFFEPVLDEEVVETIVPAKIERRLTGTVTKSIKYSVVYLMMLIAIQEQQEIINDLAARVTELEKAQ